MNSGEMTNADRERMQREWRRMGEFERRERGERHHRES
jgi:hypothetical protein